MDMLRCSVMPISGILSPSKSLFSRFSFRCSSLSSSRAIKIQHRLEDDLISTIALFSDVISAPSLYSPSICWRGGYFGRRCFFCARSGEEVGSKRAVTPHCSQARAADGGNDSDPLDLDSHRAETKGAGGPISNGCEDEKQLESKVKDSAQPTPTFNIFRRKEPLLLEAEYGFWSVVIPTYNRLPILTKCLQALEEQSDYSTCGIQNFEVIVVDDGSTDGTVEFLKSWSKSNTAEGEGYYRSHLDDNSLETSAAERFSSGHRNEDDVGLDGGTNPLFVEGEGPVQESASRLHSIKRFPHAKLVEQTHKGATAARNLGLKYARGGVIVFIDSDLVVTGTFLKAHGEALGEAFLEDGDDRAFTYGRVVNTSNFHNPTSERFKFTDYSAAFFATGNVSISHRLLLKAGALLAEGDAGGPFDSQFSEYGWEDLELGVRLKQCGARIKHAPAAVGYHWHPAFCVEQLPKLIDQERQRGRNGVRFYRKHPTLDVRLMVQMTPFHEALWFLLTLGGLLNERTLEPILDRLVKAGRHRTAAALVSPVLNWHTVQAMQEECRKLNVK